MFNGVDVPVEEQLKYFYDVWGTDKTYNHMAVAWTWAFDTPFTWTKQIASHFGGTRQGMAISWPKVHQGQGRHPPPVPPRHRHRADHPRGDRDPRARGGRRHQAEPDRRREHGLHLRQGRTRTRRRTHKTQYFEMMGDRAHLPRRLDRQHQGRCGRPGSSPAPANRIRSTTHVGALRPDARTGRSRTTWRRRTRRSSRSCRTLFWAEAQKYQVLPLDASVATRLITPRPSITAGRDVFTWTATADRHAATATRRAC